MIFCVLIRLNKASATVQVRYASIAHTMFSHMTMHCFRSPRCVDEDVPQLAKRRTCLLITARLDLTQSCWCLVLIGSSVSWVLNSLYCAPVRTCLHEYGTQCSIIYKCASRVVAKMTYQYTPNWPKQTLELEDFPKIETTPFLSLTSWFCYRASISGETSDHVSVVLRGRRRRRPFSANAPQGQGHSWGQLTLQSSNQKRRTQYQSNSVRRTEKSLTIFTYS